MGHERGNEAVPAGDQGPWPGVAEPHRLLHEITDWLSGYGNAATRRTYAEGLGLPTSPADLREWITTPPSDPPPADTTSARPPSDLADARLPEGADAHEAEPVWTWTPAPPSAATAPDPDGRHHPGRHQERRHGRHHDDRDHGHHDGHHHGFGHDGRWRDPVGSTGTDRWAEAVARYAALLGTAATRATAGTPAATSATTSARTTAATPAATGAGVRTAGATDGAATRTPPPPASRGRLRALHWFRWCANHGTDPLAATSTQVKAWLADLDTAGAATATRDRMLATVKALYTHLADTGLAAGNPAALNRRRLGLATPAGTTTRTVVLTTGQVRALVTAAATARRGASHLDTARAAAVVGLFTLGLRVGELCDLNRDDLHVTRGRRALRVRGKGGKTRVVYLHDTAERALLGYLRIRDTTATTETKPATRTKPDPTAPLLVTRTGGRYRRQAVWQLLRRLATAAGDPLRDVADAMHPHALRHFYVTTAVESGAQLVHVQADVGHTSVDTTEQVYNNAARDPARSAVDLVGDTLRE